MLGLQVSSEEQGEGVGGKGRGAGIFNHHTPYPSRHTTHLCHLLLHAADFTAELGEARLPLWDLMGSQVSHLRGGGDTCAIHYSHIRTYVRMYILHA